MTKLTLTLCACVTLLFSSCAKQPDNLDAVIYRKEIEGWQAKRFAELKGESGWLTLVGLFWLEAGESKMGSDASNTIKLPEGKAPPHVGLIRLDAEGVVRFEPHAGVEVKHEGKAVRESLQLKTDADGKPTVLRLGSLTFNVIKRGARVALRVKDSEHPDRVKFAGVESFPAHLKWRVAARFEPYSPPKQIPIANVVGTVENQPSPGAIVFELEGKTYRLDALEEKGNKDFFVIFDDATSGKETYGAGRYLYVEPPDENNKFVIDFNKAHNPPCAFTNFATCPLPPAQNRLAVRVEAGEKKYAH